VTTTFKIDVRRECGSTYAKAFGVEGNGLTSFVAVSSLIEQLARMLATLEGAAKYGSLSPAGLSDLEALRGIFSPQEPESTSTMVSRVHKK